MKREFSWVTIDQLRPGCAFATGERDPMWLVVAMEAPTGSRMRFTIFGSHKKGAMPIFRPWTPLYDSTFKVIMLGSANSKHAR